MSEHKMWLWRIQIVNGDVAGVSAQPADQYRGTAEAVVTSMYRNMDGDFVTEIDTVAATRADAERLACEVFDRDVPDDMRGR